jgi:flagellar basal body-associated protein FliL
MENTNGIKTWQWVVTVVVIIVLIIIGIMVFGNKGPATPVTPEVQQTTQTTTAINQIIMSDQYPGNVVNVSSVQLSSPGFVVIQADASGKSGAVLGCTLTRMAI